MSAPDNRIAICPGTYDPVTYGHLDVIARAARMFENLVVAVVNVPIRKGSTLFSIEERVEMLSAEVTDIENVEVESFDTLVVEFARRRGAHAIVKGLRSITDFGYEFEMNQLNRRQDPEIESVYLMASPEYSFLSSSGVKELATFGAAIDDLVPEPVARRLQERLAR
jgi:pantetheine-phosphate adenylyltransferase